MVNDPADSLQTWLVGGAVRDRLIDGGETTDLMTPANSPESPMKECSGDRDWVVIGATPEQMLDLGFKAVGRDFPVFLHPTTHEEYALARTERKQGTGYRGFSVHADPSVTLEEDLSRRDLTINAMALNATGELCDPFGGTNDVKNRVLRHVSDAFAEDPVRVLRVARFCARFTHLGFTIAPQTRALMKALVKSGEVNELVAERLWRETQRALGEQTPSAFFNALRECGALAIVFPEIDALFGIPQTAKWHPEIDTGIHVMMVIDEAARRNLSNRARFACLCHDLGKAQTPTQSLPSHPKHEHNGLPLVDVMCERLRVPKDYLRLARLVCRHHLKMHQLADLKAGTVVSLLDQLGVFQQDSMLEEFATSCAADARGRLGREDIDYPQHALLIDYARAAQQVTAQTFVEQGLRGAAIGDAIAQARCKAIADVRARASAVKA